MGRIPEDTLQTVRDRVDIVDLVGRYVSLKKAGRSHKGLCPFHHEKTPSFVVTPERGTWHCFGCGEGGNAFAFLMRHENLTFPEAVRSLAAELGIEIPESDTGERGVLEGVLRANALAQEYYQRSLAGEEGRAARDYLAGRGLGAEESSRFGIGFAPDRWEGVVEVLRRAHLAGEVAERAGLARARSGGGHYDLLRGRVVFPIQDARGRVIAFGGRAHGRGPGPEVPEHAREPGVPEARGALRAARARSSRCAAADRAIVVEGYFDQIALVRAGLGEAVATCGTALTEEHAKSLSRRTRNVVLLFDGDEAGQRAMLRALEVMLPAGLRVRAAALPGGADPDDFLRREGAEALRQLVDARAARARGRDRARRRRGLPHAVGARRRGARGDAAARARARSGRARRVRAPARAGGGRGRRRRRRGAAPRAQGRRARGRAGAAAPHGPRRPPLRHAAARC